MKNIRIQATITIVISATARRQCTVCGAKRVIRFMIPDEELREKHLGWHCDPSTYNGHGCFEPRSE